MRGPGRLGRARSRRSGVLQGDAAPIPAWCSWSSCTCRPITRARSPSMLQRWTAMPVVQASDGQKVEPNHVYVIPPGKHLTAVNGHLRLTDLEHEHGRRVAVDLFFRSLADTPRPHAAAVVLSGADGDGALGIKRIKERGGLTIAQDPDEAEHDGMPRAAIDVRHGRLGAQRRARCRRASSTTSRTKHASSCRPRTARSPPLRSPRTCRSREAAFREVLVFLRTRTGRDFSYYKRATILRRIARRMQVNGAGRHAGVPRVPAHASRRGGRAAQGPADLRHEFLSRPRSVRGARGAHPAAVRGQGRTATPCASGARPAPPARRPIRSR